MLNSTKGTIFVIRNVLKIKIMNIKPTVLDFAILGLIQDNSLSGYAIRKMFEETALGSYSSSPGTIYPALKRLQKGGLVEKISQIDSAKSSFKITQQGLLILKSWFLKPIEKVDVEKKINELLLRFGFMESLIDKQQRIHFLISFQEELIKYISELETYYKSEGFKMPLHGKLAFQYGIESNKTTLKWCKKSILQLT